MSFDAVIGRTSSRRASSMSPPFLVLDLFVTWMNQITASRSSLRSGCPLRTLTICLMGGATCTLTRRLASLELTWFEGEGCRLATAGLLSICHSWCGGVTRTRRSQQLPRAVLCLQVTSSDIKPDSNGEVVLRLTRSSKTILARAQQTAYCTHCISQAVRRLPPSLLLSYSCSSTATPAPFLLLGGKLRHAILNHLYLFKKFGKPRI